MCVSSANRVLKAHFNSEVMFTLPVSPLQPLSENSKESLCGYQLLHAVREQILRIKQKILKKKIQQPFIVICILGFKRSVLVYLFVFSPPLLLRSIHYFSNRNTNVLKSIFFLQITRKSLPD